LYLLHNRADRPFANIFCLFAPNGAQAAEGVRLFSRRRRAFILCASWRNKAPPAQNNSDVFLLWRLLAQYSVIDFLSFPAVKLGPSIAH
jgi:hypothetical protein